MARSFEHDVVRAAARLVEHHGQLAREYVAEVIAIATGRGTPGRLDELAGRMARQRRQGAPSPEGETVIN